MKGRGREIGTHNRKREALRSYIGHTTHVYPGWVHAPEVRHLYTEEMVEENKRGREG